MALAERPLPAISFPCGDDLPVEPSFASGNEDFSSHPSDAQSHRFAAGPGLANIKEIQRLRGGDLQVAAQANVQIDAEIGQKDHFRIGNARISTDSPKQNRRSRSSR